MSGQIYRLGPFGCALFDIDGVLVDVRKSYNAAIKKTVDFMLRQISGKAAPRNIVTDRVILKFRQTGGFNNDTDTSYAITLATLAWIRKERQNEKSGKGVLPPSAAPARRFVLQVADNADSSGYISVEKYLSSLFGKGEVEEFKDRMAYPGSIKESVLARVFDELFYGKELFARQHGTGVKYCDGANARPLIKNDRMVATRKTMKKLNAIFHGNLAIVSGRSKVAAEYSLGPMFDLFNLEACAFLEDEKREHAKPNPYAIKRAMKIMGAKDAVYVGDSAEDLLMARMAEKEMEARIAFVGIYGCSPRPAVTKRQFKESKVEAIRKSVNELPSVLAKC